jgi:hypothetical protein
VSRKDLIFDDQVTTSPWSNLWPPPDPEPKFTYPTILVHLHTSKSPLAVGDGQVQFSQVTFGWVLATVDRPNNVLIAVDEQAVVHGFLPGRNTWFLFSRHLLDLMSKFFHNPLRPITVRCDSMSVVQKIYSITTRARPMFPNDTLRPSWDIVEAICGTFQAHSSHSLQHVKGHQDCATHCRNLSLEAQLNILADKLSSVFKERSIHGTDLGPMIPGSQRQVVMESRGRAITVAGFELYVAKKMDVLDPRKTSNSC